MSAVENQPPPPAVRWTESSIRKAMLHPKPQWRAPRNGRALAVLLGEQLTDDRPMTRTERLALEQLATCADIILAAGQQWLLIPATPALVDAISEIGASTEDLEADVDAELDDPAERTATEWNGEASLSLSVDRDDDDEVTKPESLDQSRLVNSNSDDLEDEFGQRLREGESLRELMPGFAMPWQDKHCGNAPWRRTLESAIANTRANAVRTVRAAE